MTLLKQQENGTGMRALATPPSWTDAEIPMPLRRNEVRDYRIDGESVLFDPRSHKMYLLNQTALAVFRCCDGQTTMREVAESLTKTYRVVFETALDHVEQLVALFAASQLLDLGTDS